MLGTHYYFLSIKSDTYENFLECHGVKVKEQGDKICSSEKQNEPAESDNEIYYLEKFLSVNKGRLRKGGGGGEESGSPLGSEQAKVAGAGGGESPLGSEQAKVAGAKEGESPLGSEQAKVAGAKRRRVPVRLRASKSGWS